MRRAALPTLTAAEGAAWGGFLRAHATIVRRLDHELRTACDLDLNEYEILLQLAWAGGAQRMRELAQAALLTGSGVTRVVARLEAADCVRRRPDPDDRRGVVAVLERSGYLRLEAAQRVHLAGIRKCFVSPVGARSLAPLADAFARIVEHTPLAAASDAAPAGTTASRHPNSR